MMFLRIPVFVGLASRTEYAVLGRVIAQARTELGLSQRSLARQSGRTETSIHKIEAGDQRADMVELLDIARALRISLTELSSRFEEALRD